MVERSGTETNGVLWDALRTIIAAMKAYLVPDNPATGQDFAAAAIETATSPAVRRALAAETGGIEAEAVHAIAEAVSDYLARRLDQEGLIGAAISAVDRPAIAIALFGRAEER